jgi:NADH-quinone oxidoreductase subunit C
MSGADARERLAGRPGVSVVADGPPLTVGVEPDGWVDTARFARTELGCVFFSFLTAVDHGDEGLEVVLAVTNVDTKLSLVLKTRLGAGVTTCPSLVPVFKGADWMERECFDMFGIRFEGHPDLRRMLLPDDWDGHPLLKSYDVDTPHPPYR